ncbi:MAG: hypothetical protein ACUVQQ_00770 [Thermogutta sp.]
MVHNWQRCGGVLRCIGGGMSILGIARPVAARRQWWIGAGLAALAAVFLLAISGAGLWGAEDTANSPSPPAVPPPSNPPGGGNSGDAAPVSGPTRLREGTSLRGLIGTIRPVGERWTLFLSQRDERYILLENLALERILRTNASFTEAPDWTIDGTVTEFRGQNYLLIEKALIGRVTPPPAVE